MTHRLKEIDCPECNKTGQATDDDYMCLACRAKLLPEEGNSKASALASHVLNLYEGWLLMRESDSWIELCLVDDFHAKKFTYGETYQRREGFAIWKHTGEVYRIGIDGAVDDDPMPREEFLVYMHNAAASNF